MVSKLTKKIGRIIHFVSKAKNVGFGENIWIKPNCLI